MNQFEYEKLLKLRDEINFQINIYEYDLKVKECMLNGHKWTWMPAREEFGDTKSSHICINCGFHEIFDSYQE